MPVIISEAERSAEAARDRFRKVTQAALERFQESVIASRIYSGIAGEKFLETCAEAAAEYCLNPIATSNDPDITDLTCED